MRDALENEQTRIDHLPNILPQRLSAGYQAHQA